MGTSSNAITQWSQGLWGSSTYGNPPLFSLDAGYYLNLITPYYRNSPEWQQWLSVLFGLFEDINFCAQQITTAYDLDYAIGVQLDTLGAIAGVSRTVPFQPSLGASAVLDDSTYRLLIKATIFNNQWDGKLTSIHGIWQALFPGGGCVIDDNFDMTADVIISGPSSSIMIDLIRNDMIVPRPQGVLYNFIFSAQPVFGADYNNAYIAGADTGHAA